MSTTDLTRSVRNDSVLREMDAPPRFGRTTHLERALAGLTSLRLVYLRTLGTLEVGLPAPDCICPTAPGQLLPSARALPIM